MSTHSSSAISHLEGDPAARASRGQRATSTRIPVWRVGRAGARAAVIGAVVLYGYGATARALSVPMHAGDPGGSAAQPVTPLNFAVGVVFCTVLGTVLAALVGRYGRRPGRTFVRTAVTLLVVSLVFPLAASHTAASTRVCLALAHLLAAAVVVPQLARALRH